MWLTPPWGRLRWAPLGAGGGPWVPWADEGLRGHRARWEEVRCRDVARLEGLEDPAVLCPAVGRRGGRCRVAGPQEVCLAQCLAAAGPQEGLEGPCKAAAHRGAREGPCRAADHREGGVLLRAGGAHEAEAESEAEGLRVESVAISAMN